MKAAVGQADRVRKLQTININALFECEKKQTEDENQVSWRSPPLCPPLCPPHGPPHCPASCAALPQAQMEFFRSRLIDTIEEKRKKAAAQQAGTRSGKVDGKRAASKRRRENATEGAALPAAFVLKPEELKADLEEIATNVDHYSVRSAAVASDELRAASSGDAYFDRSRQMLHCNGHSHERGSTVFVYMQGQRVDDAWTLTAMNAVEVTLRDAEGQKLKVSLAQLRNGRYAFRPAPGYHV